MVSLFQTAAGAWHWPSILAALGWLAGFLVAGGFLLANLSVNRDDRLRAAAKDAENRRILTEARAETAVAQVEATKARALVEELERKQAPRRLSETQRAKFKELLAQTPKGPVSIVYVSPAKESIEFTAEIRGLLENAGFTLPPTTEYSLAYTVPTSSPWFLAMIVGEGTEPSYTLPMQNAFRAIGIEATGVDGRQIAKPGELKIYVGGR